MTSRNSSSNGNTALDLVNQVAVLRELIEHHKGQIARHDLELARLEQRNKHLESRVRALVFDRYIDRSAGHSLFMRLPPELRHIIWELAAGHVRAEIVELRRVAGPGWLSACSEWDFRLVLTNRNRMKVSQVCAEARALLHPAASSRLARLVDGSGRRHCPTWTYLDPSVSHIVVSGNAWDAGPRGRRLAEFFIGPAEHLVVKDHNNTKLDAFLDTLPLPDDRTPALKSVTFVSLTAKFIILYTPNTCRHELLSWPLRYIVNVDNDAEIDATDRTISELGSPVTSHQTTPVSIYHRMVYDQAMKARNARSGWPTPVGGVGPWESFRDYVMRKFLLRLWELHPASNQDEGGAWDGIDLDHPWCVNWTSRLPEVRRAILVVALGATSTTRGGSIITSRGWGM